MDCRLFSLLIERYYDGELDAAERAEYENHRRGCEGCRALDARYALIDSALARMPLFEPSPEFNKKVMARVDVSAYRKSPAERALGALGALWNAAPAPVRNGAAIATVCVVFIAIYKPLLDSMVAVLRQGADGLWSGMMFMKAFLGKAEVVWEGIGALETYRVVGQTLARALQRYAAGLHPVQVAAALAASIVIVFVLYRTLGAARGKGETNVGIL